MKSLLREFLGQLAWPPFVPDLPLAALARRYELPTSRYLDIDGMKVHVSVEGKTDAPVLVLVHGLVSSLHTWNGWAQELADTFRIVRFDLPGFGLTGPHPKARYDADTLVSVLEKLRVALGIEKMHLAGNSLGGFTSWLYAARHPERVEKLILIDPVAYPQDVLPFIRLLSLPGSGYLGRRLNPSRSVARGVIDVFGDPSKVPPDAVRRYQELTLRPGNRDALVGFCRTMMQMHGKNPFQTELTTLRVPTLLLWGALDRWIPPRHVALWQRDVPGLQAKVYPGVGHVPMEEEPELTAADARAFLAA